VKTGPGDMMLVNNLTQVSGQTSPNEFCPTRPAPEYENNGFKLAGGILGAIDGTRPANTRRKAAWARPIQKVHEVDPLACVIGTRGRG
jgi:hypothetical protein